MSNLAVQIESVANSPPVDAAERRALYDASKKLLNAVEDPFDTIYRVNNSPMILTFSHIACELGVFNTLAKSTVPVTVTALAKSSQADPLLLSRILRFLASHDLINEADENTFAANTITHTLARPGFEAGIAHSFMAIMPCLLVAPQFLADTKYANPDDLVHSPFQAAHKTKEPAFAWAISQPRIMDDFNLWMSELHDGRKTWLDVFDFAGHAANTSADTLLFVDIGGGIGQQCAILKNVHSNLPGRVVLQDQPFVIPQALPVEGVDKQSYDIWTEQPLKGAKVYYLRNILHDYPDEKCVTIIQNTLPAMSSESVLVIDEIIIPNKGSHSRATEIDMTMMVSFASTERTEKQWASLLDKAGLKVLSKDIYNEATGQSAIVAVPK
ncbi:S-adenosyl-L-methionine-dependent methyltransferase [Trichoderma barbatum]